MYKFAVKKTEQLEAKVKGFIFIPLSSVFGGSHSENDHPYTYSALSILKNVKSVFKYGYISE